MDNIRDYINENNVIKMNFIQVLIVHLHVQYALIFLLNLQCA